MSTLVVFVHGFMGSSALVHASKIWPEVDALRSGKIVSLAAAHKRVAFQELVELGAPPGAWTDVPELSFLSFVYDWRRAIDQSALDLGRFLDRKLEGRTAHLVAHGMGGLVCRSLFRQRPQLWEKLAEKGLDRGGRLVLVGTPSGGTFDAAAILAGVHPLPRWVDILDLTHTMDEVNAVFRSFPSLYQLLPPDCKALHDAASWGKAALDPELLAGARAFHDSLSEAEPLAPSRVVCVVGSSKPTRVGLREVRIPGRLEFEISLAGDGMVPAALAVLPNVPVYEAHGGHGALLGGGSPSESKALCAGIAEILLKGTTTRLATWVARSPTSFREQAVRRQRVEVWLHQIARGLEKEPPALPEGAADPSTAHRVDCELHVHQALKLATLGEEAGAELAIEQALTAHLRATRGPRLEVTVMRGDITKVKTPLLVIGHYLGAPPNGSEAAVDRALGSWISRAIAQRFVRAELGETFVVPTGGLIAAHSVLLVGKGPAGHLSLDDLRYLAINVAFTAASLRLRKITTVALGTGRGELSRKAALRALVEGLREGLLRWVRVNSESAAGAEVASFCLEIIEWRKAAYQATKDFLGELDKEDQVKLLAARELDEQEAPASEPPPDEEVEQTTRITIEESHSVDGPVYRFSAIGGKASVPLHLVRVQPRFLEELTNHLLDPGTSEHERFGKLFYLYLFPEALRDMLEDPAGVTLVLDEAAAALPWEMACIQGASGPIRLGIDHPISRQLRTRLSAAPAVTPPLSDQMNVLIIADPASGSKLELAEARREGEELQDYLEKWRRENKARCRVVTCIGSDQCDPVALLDLLFQGDFDVIHFTGHGTFDPTHPARSGWVLRDNLILSAGEMFRARRVPRLVFANACWTSAMPSKAARHPGRELVGMAEAFMSMGVESYIGACRPVDAHVATVLALDFYREALAGVRLDQALSHARGAAQKLGNGTWGAFQLYGAGGTRLVPVPGPPRARSKTEEP